MSLLTDIQGDLLNEDTKLGPILLKLRFLASRLGVPILEDWVKHETEGYLKEAAVPEYRKVKITYSGTCQSMTQIMHDVPIPNVLIEKHAGVGWLTTEIREGITVVDARVARREEGAMFGINTGDLGPRLQNKIYQNAVLLKIVGRFDISAFINIQASVRAKVLDLTLEIEKTVPAAAEIVIGVKPAPLADSDAEKVAQVTYQVFYAPVTQITNTGTAGPMIVNSMIGDTGELIKALVKVGLSDGDARELAEIVQSEPGGAGEVPGKGAKAWIATKAKGAMAVAGKIGTPIAIDLIESAIKAYYGM